MILVDSTVWIDLLRACKTAPVDRLRKLLDAGEATVAPVIVQELLQGATDASTFVKLQRYFTAIPMSGAENSLELHVTAGHLYARARWQGVTPRSPHDCLIAATAVVKRLPLLHDDRDFEQLALVEPKLKLIPRR
ncbi:MAG: PIN domain-containing protein [Pseudomonadota bacterium]|nr:PIN domain-containing protein [Pseudomonadota bacterium]